VSELDASGSGFVDTLGVRMELGGNSMGELCCRLGSPPKQWIGVVVALISR
jgi:hypothetical protein